LEHGIPCHDTFGRVFAAIDPGDFGAAFMRWVGQDKIHAVALGSGQISMRLR